MIDYKLFREVVISRIKSFLPEDLRHGEVVMHKVNRDNRRIDGLMIRYPGVRVAPVIYPELFYEDYKRTDDLNRTLQEMAHTFTTVFREHPDYDLAVILSRTDHIVYKLVNTAANQQMLADAPHRKMQDLSIVYMMVLNPEEHSNTMETMRITNDIAEAMELTEPQLYQLAKENTKRLFPPELISLNHIKEELFGIDEQPEVDMVAVRNKFPEVGAAVMLDSDFMEAACRSVGDGCYILPSSRFEVLLLPGNLKSLPELAEMVWEVNHVAVLEEDRLSNQVYAYDPDKREIVTACEVKEKNITDEAYQDAEFELVEQEEQEQTLKKQQSQQKEQKGPRL